MSECIEIFSQVGASEHQIIDVLDFLQRNGLVRSSGAEDIDQRSVVVVSRSGGYYFHRLSRMFIYVEQCLFDTAIEDSAVWHELSQWTQQVEKETSGYKRMRHRATRMKVFLNYLLNLEGETLALIGGAEYLSCVDEIHGAVLHELSVILEKMSRKKAGNNTRRKRR